MKVTIRIILITMMLSIASFITAQKQLQVIETDSTIVIDGENERDYIVQKSDTLTQAEMDSLVIAALRDYKSDIRTYLRANEKRVKQAEGRLNRQERAHKRLKNKGWQAIVTISEGVGAEIDKSTAEPVLSYCEGLVRMFKSKAQLAKAFSRKVDYVNLATSLDVKDANEYTRSELVDIVWELIKNC